MRVGLGTGSTVAHLLPAIAARGLAASAASPPRSRPRSRRASSGIPVEQFDTLERLDIAIDGTDQVDARRLADQGRRRRPPAREDRRRGGRPLRRHRRLEQAGRALRPPVPLELLAFGLAATLARARPGRAARRPAQPGRRPDRRSLGAAGRSRTGGGAARRHAGRARPRPVRARARRRRARRPRRRRRASPDRLSGGTLRFSAACRWTAGSRSGSGR